VDESKVTLGLAEPYLKDVKEAKQAFALLQSKTYSPFSADQAKQVTGALDSLGSSIMKVCFAREKRLGVGRTPTIPPRPQPEKRNRQVKGADPYPKRQTGRLKGQPCPSVTVGLGSGRDGFSPGAAARHSQSARVQGRAAAEGFTLDRTRVRVNFDDTKKNCTTKKEK